MNLLYQAGIALYSGGVKVAAIWHKKARAMVKGHRHTMSRLAELNRRLESAGRGDAERVWIHAASLGEFEQGRPLIERIRAERPDAVIILSFFSPSGMEVRQDYDKADQTVYLPFDTPLNARRFIKALRPSMAVFVKYEFWGNYLSELHRRGIPTYLISGIFRREQPFFRFYGHQFRKMLRCFTRLYIQNETSRRLLESIGITNVVVNGDTRLDRVYQIMEGSHGDEILDDFVASRNPHSKGGLLIAGSTWPEDEVHLFRWLRRHSEYRSVIAPHEMDERRLATLRLDLGEGTYLLSELRAYKTAHGAIPSGVQHIIIDCYGLLSSIYRYGSFAYIGGGFGAGIHNINEAAVYGIPVVFGPNYHKFQEAKDLIANGGGFSVGNAEEMSQVFDTLAVDSKARHVAGQRAGEYIKASRGATDVIFTDLFERRR